MDLESRRSPCQSTIEHQVNARSTPMTMIDCLLSSLLVSISLMWPFVSFPTIIRVNSMSLISIHVRVRFITCIEQKQRVISDWHHSVLAWPLNPLRCRSMNILIYFFDTSKINVIIRWCFSIVTRWRAQDRSRQTGRITPNSPMRASDRPWQRLGSFSHFICREREKRRASLISGMPKVLLLYLRCRTTFATWLLFSSRYWSWLWLPSALLCFGTDWNRRFTDDAINACWSNNNNSTAVHQVTAIIIRLLRILDHRRRSTVIRQSVVNIWLHPLRLRSSPRSVLRSTDWKIFRLSSMMILFPGILSMIQQQKAIESFPRLDIELSVPPE